MPDQPTAATGSQRQELATLLELVDALLEQAEEISDQWAELARALGEEEPAAESPGSVGRDEVAGEESRDADPRRMIAVEMLLSGSSREEVEEYLQNEFGLSGNDDVLDDVFSGRG